MKYCLLLLSIAFGLNVNGQGRSQKDKPVREIFEPKMPEAHYDLKSYIEANMHYPDSARVHNIEGRVIVKFVVDEDGSIADCTVVKGIDRYCDDEALRVVRAMPPWMPGVINGKPVKVYFTLPIVFKLD